MATRHPMATAYALGHHYTLCGHRKRSTAMGTFLICVKHVLLQYIMIIGQNYVATEHADGQRSNAIAIQHVL